MDKPNLVVCCVVGDGEAETGPVWVACLEVGDLLGLHVELIVEVLDETF